MHKILIREYYIQTKQAGIQLRNIKIVRAIARGNTYCNMWYLDVFNTTRYPKKIISYAKRHILCCVK